MMKFSRLPLFIALIMVLLTVACGAQQGTSPTSTVATLLPGNINLTSTPILPTETTGTMPTASSSEIAATVQTSPTTGLETATVNAGSQNTQSVGTQSSSAGTTQTSGIPVTGQDIMLVECQFCVDTQAHALLVLPDSATYKIISPAASTSSSSTANPAPACSTVEVNNGKQVVLCSGPEMTPLVLNICTDANTCTDFPVDLLACPLTPGGNGASVTPVQTQGAPTNVVGTVISPTLNPGVTISTATPAGGAAATTTPTP